MRGDYDHVVLRRGLSNLFLWLQLVSFSHYV